MEITRDALMRVVKAARTSARMAENMKSLLDGNGTTAADTVYGFLYDAIFMMLDEKLTPAQDFKKDSMAHRLLTGPMSDGDVTDFILMKDSLNRRIRECEEERQPKPQVIDPAKVQEMYRQNGGYQFHSPEGG